MFQNFKTDIIYYNTSTDFELEFNLCGCCKKMRLLNDKCEDKKTLLLSLSRAVSRSKVIIITAPLFTEEKIISTIASSIGSGVEIIDNKQYNIASQAEIEIIKESVPLVTEDGIFGGCIIESGPQSLILLTDNKSVRKSIMNSLIHPYIKEIADGDNGDCILDEKEVIIDSVEETKETQPEEETTEDDEVLEETKEAQPEEASTNTAEVLEETAPEADTFEDIISSSFEDDIPASNEDYITVDSDFGIEYFSDSEDDDEPITSPFNLLLLIISLLLLVTLAVLCYCIFYVPTKAGIEPAVYLKDIFDTMF